MNTARTDLLELLSAWAKRHELTLTEELMLLTGYQSDQLQAALREERKRTRKKQNPPDPVS